MPTVSEKNTLAGARALTRQVRGPNPASQYNGTGPSLATCLDGRSETLLPADVCERALNARDARFDGIFFVGIITTRVYCRPVCPARVSYHDHRRFFDTAASAERAGFRPCLRCRPELAPGRATVDAVPRLAWVAAQRIGAGALNGGDVTQLARELGVSDRHLRRALQRELGVSPAELAQTHRLLLAKRLLADTSLSVTHIAFASGFQSLRRFNAAFRERYRLSPSELQRPPRPAKATRIASRNTATPTAPANDFIRLTLAYRAPLAWDVLMAVLRREAIPGVEEVVNGSYRRTVRINERSGVVIAEDATDTAYGPARMAGSHLNVDVSLSLLPVLMPLLARLRQLFDLDAEPSVVDAHLEQAGLGTLVRQRPGVRMPGAVDGFEVALRSLLGASGAATSQLAQRVAWALGEPLDTGLPTLTRLAPSAARVAEAGASRLESLGVPPARALAIDATARRLADGSLRLAPGDDVRAAHRALLEIEGVDDRLAAAIVMRALRWPDAFPSSDGSLQRAAGAANPKALREKAEDWRPWRGYAAMHLWLQDDEV
ncbi:MAG: helix-turn-helix domain-containing protein [Anaerolineae bacterium]|nr:helix-turn-helix domain-containing protein [Gemmatimonadaceae bacterium]